MVVSFSMVKYLGILAVNIFLLYCVVLFFMDNRILTKDPLVIIRNLFIFSIAVWICYNLVSIYLIQSQQPESALVYKMAINAKEFTNSFFNYIEPFKKELGVWSLVALGLMILGIISVGITGYIWLAIPVKLGLVSEITGDAAWPAAIVMSLAWPLLLPIAVVIKHELIQRGYLQLAVPGFWGVVVLGIILLITLIHLGNKKT